MRFKNTHLLTPAANYYKKHGVYTKKIPGTKEYREFWIEERRRCLEGYEAGGMKITGYHYHYLNYFPISRPVVYEYKGRKVKKRVFDFPDFYDTDYDYFWLCEIARYGIDKEEYEKLNLDVDVHPEDLGGERQMVVLKARRKGYSYKAASMLARNYFHMKKSKNVVYAFDKKYLEGDGIYQKFLDGMAFIDENTAFRQPQLVTRPAQMYIKSGYTEVVDGTEIDKGFQSMVQGVSLKDNPDGVRGGAKELVFFEEMGKFPGLKKAWDVGHHMIKEGTDSLGLMIAFGTGGTEGADFEGAEELFYKPKSNDILRVNNKWDDGADGTYCGFFVPIYTNLRGFIDEHGNSQIDKAIEYENGQRKKKKADGTSDTYSQYVAETPFNPREAILTFDKNIFPTQEIAAHLNDVKANQRYNFGVPGMLYQDKDLNVKFKPDSDVKPVYRFPHGKQDDVEGAIVIYEAPFRLNGKVPRDMYVACHDPFAQDTTTTGISLGATYIIKRTNNLSPTMNETIVASYVGRPSSQDEYNRNLFLLAEYYGCKIGFENDRGDVIGYAKRFKKLHYLEEQFSFLDKKELQGKTRRPYGMNMTKARKEQGEIYIRDWLLTPVTKYDNGEETLVLHTILDPALLEELLKFHKDGNFDRVMAIMIGMYHMKEKFNKKVKQIQESKHEEFFTRLYGR